jgi:hypothetical protein
MPAYRRTPHQSVEIGFHLDGVVELSLLLEDVRAGGPGGFLFQREVQAFAPAILLRMPHAAHGLQ